MRSLVIAVSLCTLTACAQTEALRSKLGPVGSQDDEKASSNVEQEVRAFLEHYLRALESRDEARIRALFVTDGRLAWFTDGALAYSSPDEILAGLRGFGEMDFHTESTDVRVLPLTDTFASASSKFETRLTMNGAPVHTYGGVITWLLERVEGKWRVLQGHTSTPGGPPTDGDDRR
ncbi:MAG: nuclear transport factor 2 family protein [Planctomycetota bacterium]